MNGAVSSTSSPSGVQGACPTGWHLPSYAEWTTLEIYLGGSSIAGGKMKETGTEHWLFPNTGATNESGFTALPGGCRYDQSGSFNFLSSRGTWWSSSQTRSNTDAADYLMIFSNVGSSIGGNNEKNCGFSVRCLKD